jgi:uncharacterized protein YecT (DUF1311 family)
VRVLRPSGVDANQLQDGVISSKAWASLDFIKLKSEMRELLILICCAVLSRAAPQSVRDIDWKNFSYPLSETGAVPGEVRWMASNGHESARLTNGSYVVPDDCSDDIHSCPLVTLDSVKYGPLTGIKSTAAVLVLTYHSGGTANWQYVYVFTLESGKPRLLAWLRTGSRADRGLREVSIDAGDLFLEVNDPDKRQGDCCSAGRIVTRYRWEGSSFSNIGQPVLKTDPPSFDCAKAKTPVELLICKDVELSFLDSQMANSYQRVLKAAAAKRKETIRRQQAEWFAEYTRTCAASLSETERRDCIERYLSDRLITIWK